jgi:lipoprotein-anchoring transpeptidase ErfK/SrfK
VALARFDQVVMSTCHACHFRSANAVFSECTVRNKARGRGLTAMTVQGCGLRSFHMPFGILLCFIFLAGSIAIAKPLDVQAVNEAQWDTTPAKSRALTTRAQILLARSNFSPGEIDGNPGENLDKAIAAFAASQGVATNKLTQELWQKLTSMSDQPALVDYTISDDDLRGPFAEKIPEKMEDMKDLPGIPYRNPKEKISEKFHMSPDLLAALNPGQNFATAGVRIVVANVSTSDLPKKVARMEVDKSGQALRAFAADGNLLAYYPATVGSREKPAPTGTLKVTGVRKNPTYRYNPDYAFKGVRSTKPFTIKPGPNNPVGLVWIGLSGEGYGVHGTPEPSKISKAESHGCVRLTNWDALQLASAVSKGTPVEFIGEQKSPSASKYRQKRAGR